MLLKSFKGIVGLLGAYTNTYLVYDEITFDDYIWECTNK